MESAKEEYLAGEGTVAITGGGNESLVITDALSNSKTITMSTSGVTSGTKIVFVLPAGTLKHGFNVYFYAGDEQFDAVSTSADMEIEAGKMNIVTVDHVVNIQAATIRLDAVTTTTLEVPYEINDECVSASIQCATDEEFTNIVGTKNIELPNSKAYTSGSVTFEGLQEATLYHVRILVKTSEYQEEIPYCTIVAETLGGDVPPTPTTPKFSVDDGVYVTFAPGNLWYDGSKFLFEESQWSFGIGEYNGVNYNWLPNHVSHFYWSSDKDAAAAGLYNFSAEVQTSDKFFTDVEGFTVEGEQANEWRTLTSEEWDYLFNSRTQKTTFVNYKNLNVGDSFETVAGYVLLPDDNNSIDVLNSITSTDDLVTYGAVFLPYTGCRYEYSDEPYVNLDIDNLYWSSTVIEDGSPDAMQMVSYGCGMIYPNVEAFVGCAIRLVKNVE